PADPSGGIEVAVVQPNIDFGRQWRQEMYGQNLEVVMEPTLDALRRAAPRLIVWPESAVTFFVAQDATYRGAIANALAYRQAQLILGAPHRDVLRDDAPAYNSAFLLAPSGEVLGRYDKRQLLPFAEYPPFPSLTLLRRDFGSVASFATGAPQPPLPTVAGRAGILICNEAMFPPLAGERVRDGAQLLVTLSNDSWVNDVTFSEIVFTMVAFRAVEQRRWLVRSSTSGPSAIVDPAGRVTVRTRPFTRQAVLGRVAPRDELTLYGRWGDWFPLACVAVVGAMLVWRRSRRPAAGRARDRRDATP
ncbi:MAG: apolipoprotein N-acyltransferase, partial [Candidatus Binatia bacterium]